MKKLLITGILLSVGIVAQLVDDTAVDLAPTEEIMGEEILVEEGSSGDKLEMSVGYDTLDNAGGTESTWKNVDVSYYKKATEKMTMVFGASLQQRDAQKAGLVSMGAYMDWNPSFYTYSNISAGTETAYLFLPKYRLDQEFNLKLGEEKRWVSLLGLTYINDHDEHESGVMSMGLTYYADTFNIGARHFINKSNPGVLYSHTNLVSIGFGKQKDNTTNVDVTLGDQAYNTANVLGGYDAFRGDVMDLKLTHRRWTTHDSGWFGSVGHTKNEDSYTKNNLKLGYFKEF